MYSGIAVMGFTMFGKNTQSQITLNLPNQFVASRIALWSTVRHVLLMFYECVYNNGIMSDV